MSKGELYHRLATRFFISSLILYIAVLDNKLVVADLSVIPLWNITSNQTVANSCLLTVDNYRNEVVKFSGHPLYTCGVQVISSNGTVALIQIPQGAFLYTEMQGNIPKCQQRYVSITADESCIFLSQHSQLRLFLPGYNRTVLISGTRNNSSVPTCSGQTDPQDQHVSRVIQMKHCQIEEFNHLISCDLSSGNTCSLEFPPNCNFTLSQGVVEFECYTNNVYSSHKALIVLPTNTITLNLTNHSVIELDGNPFTNLPILQELILDHNRLSYLNPKVFSDLSTLKHLSLKSNKLTFLDDEIFKLLTALKKLTLTSNYLSTLPAGIFNGLTNLRELFLDTNRLTTLDNDTLIGLKELSELTLRENDLRYLPEGMFNDTVYLKILDLGLNKLTTLHKHLFKGFVNLITLNLDFNNLLALPEGLFNDLKTLDYLTLWRNHFKQLPYNLFWELRNLTTLDLDNSILTILPKLLFRGLSNLKVLYLQYGELISLDENLFSETNKLTHLHIAYNSLTYLPNHIFRGLHDLKKLDIGHNKLRSVPYDLFWEMNSLDYITLNYNKLKNLNGQTFHTLKVLRILHLDNNQLIGLDFNIFQDTANLRILDLSANMLNNIPDISNLRYLLFINLKENRMTEITMVTFSILPKFSELIVSQHEICQCYVSADISCTAGDDRSPFLTCDRLLADRGLVIVMWLIGLNAIGGNIFVLSQRNHKNTKNKVQSFLLSNLAISDLLMGIYMLLIASADIYFGEYFPMRAEAWRSGITCRVAGTISILSSEASVFFVTLISIDRYLNIRYPNSHRTLTKKLSTVVVGILWICSLTLGIVLSSLAGHNDKFYDNSHVCIGLPLSKLPKYDTTHSDWNWTCSGDVCYWKQPVETKYVGDVNGMIFASVVFFGLNFICYLVILVCYVEIVRTVIKSSRRAGLNTEMKEQVRMTAKVAFIVLTDFACWFPIIIMGILVQAGVLALPADVFAWCVTFVLPINSAINPYLYTIAAVISSRRKRARIAAAESQQENSNRTVTRGRQVPTSQNTQATGLEGISTSGQPSRNDNDNASRKGWLPNMPAVSSIAESNV